MRGGETGIIQLSTTTFQLDLVLTRHNSAKDLDEIRLHLFKAFEQSRSIVEDILYRAIKHHGGITKRICPLAESMMPDELRVTRRSNFCKELMLRSAHFNICQDCHFSTDIGEQFTEKSLEKPIFEMSTVMGSYDLAILWRCPTFFFGSFACAEFRRTDKPLNIVSVPLARVEWLPEEDRRKPPENGASAREKVRFDRNRNHVVLYTFLKVGDIFSLPELADVLKNIRTIRRRHLDNRIEAFLSYGDYPIVLKIEAEDDEEAHRLFWQVSKSPKVRDTWTLYGLMAPNPDERGYASTKRISVRRSTKDDPFYFLLLDLAGPRDQHRKALKDVVKRLKAWGFYGLEGEIESRGFIAGLYDYVVRFRAASSNDVIRAVLNDVRNNKNVLRSATLPTLPIPFSQSRRRKLT